VLALVKFDEVVCPTSLTTNMPSAEKPRLNRVCVLLLTYSWIFVGGLWWLMRCEWVPYAGSWR
jgi:hypothetical protein